MGNVDVVHNTAKKTQHVLIRRWIDRWFSRSIRLRGI